MFMEGSMDYFKDIYGNQRAKNILSRLISSGDVWRSFLFSGVDGVGKFLFAERFSLSILCEDRGDTVPCMGCRSCVSYKNGVSPFIRILEPQGGTISVSQVREALDFMMDPPPGGGGKVLIVRDANLLSTGASSALLKTMEEVPERSCFILIAPSPSSVLPTIKSRSFVVKFGALSIDEIEAFVAHQGYSLSREELALLYRVSGGSVGVVLEFLKKGFFSLVEELYYGIKGGDQGAVQKVFELEREEVKLVLDAFLSYLMIRGELGSPEVERVVAAYELSDRRVRPERIARFLVMGG